MGAGWPATAVLFSAALLLGSAEAVAQAWLPPKGDGYVSVLYSHLFVEKHFLPTVRYDIGHVDSHSLLMEVSYSVSDRTAISLALPFVIAKYTGTQPHQAANPDRLDDGEYHGTFADFRFNIRHGFRAGRFAIAPFAGIVLPSHQYQFFAHAAPGRRIRELVGGVTMATLLDRIRPGLYIQGQYSFAFAERVLDIRPNHSNSGLELGYFVNDVFRVFVGASGQLMHDGIDVFPREISLERLTPEQIQHHDQIGRENNLNVAIGVSFAPREGLDVFASFLKQIAGRNGHEISHALSGGITVRFSNKKVPADASDIAARAARRSAATDIRPASAGQRIGRHGSARDPEREPR